MSNFNIGNPDLNMEAQVVGEIFCDDDAAVWNFANLKAEDFGNRMMQRFFSIALMRFQSGRPYDALSVCEDFEYQSQEAKKTLYEIASATVSTEYFKEHTELIKTASAKRRMMELSEEAMNYAFDGHSISEMQTFLGNRLELFDNSNSRRSMSAAEGFRNFFEHFGEKREYIETGIIPIDKVLKMSLGDYVVMGARPSVGKTAFALQIMWNISQKYKTVFFSYETNCEKIYDRVICNQCCIPFPRIVEGIRTDVDFLMMDDVKSKVDDIKFEVVEASGMTVAEIQAEAVRRKAEVIFVDYIGLISTENDEKVVSEYEKVTKISKDLHNLAQKRRMLVFALSQLSRDASKEEPTMSTLRSSGQIEADADAILLMSRAKNKSYTEDETGRAIQIAKNKCGELGKIYMHFDGEYQKFTKVDRTEDYS